LALEEGRQAPNIKMPPWRRGQPRRRYYKCCGSPERGMRLPQCPV
jgi:hypothetical protein